jgi:hypothetical protein
MQASKLAAQQLLDWFESARCCTALLQQSTSCSMDALSLSACQHVMSNVSLLLEHLRVTNASLACVWHVVYVGSY